MNRKALVAVILAAVVFVTAAGFLGYYIFDLGFSPPPQENDEENGSDNDRVEIKKNNYLILGVDDENGRRGRTDVIMIANISPDRDEIKLLSIPRDTRVHIRGSYDKVNAAYVYGGIDLTRETIEDFLAIEIDHHFIIDFDGFVEIVDVLGGVEIEVPQRMYYPAEGIDLQPGVQVLDGKDALAFARYRQLERGDLDRIENQQAIVKALLDEAFQIGNIPKAPRMIRIGMQNVETDMSTGKIIRMLPAAERMRSKGFSAATIPGESTKLGNLWYFVSDREEAREMVREEGF